MCDTLVVLPHATKDGKLIFAKNSDRSPNEPHVVVNYPAREIDLTKEPEVKLTYLSILQVAHTHAVVLLKPDWIWGAEMGFNEFGLNIGNEAVFTKEKRNGPAALTGMDMLRLALERTKDALSALELMISLLERYGQGGNCGYDHTFYYHNSFLIADRNEAYVLETAGKYYAVKKVQDFYAISNCLSIGSDYSDIHPDTPKQAKGGAPFDFDNHYTDKLFTHFAKSRERRAFSMDALQKHAGNITVQTVMEILRGHSPRKKEHGASVGSVCMHAGGLVGDHTTGSYIAELGGKQDEYYITGTTLPCLSFYKPFVMGGKLPPVFGNEKDSKAFWYKNERLMRYLLSGQADKAAYLADRDRLEQKYLTAFKEAQNKAEKEAVMLEAWAQGEMRIEKHLAPLQNQSYRFTLGTLSYRNYWKKKTEILLANMQKYQ
ncbi:MAG: C69 family dipeptidase [Clostridia bacterium]|nr:C69 family dipeptidase [Clostridia bacterium]